MLIDPCRFTPPPGWSQSPPSPPIWKQLPVCSPQLKRVTPMGFRAHPGLITVQTPQALVSPGPWAQSLQLPLHERHPSVSPPPIPAVLATSLPTPLHPPTTASLQRLRLRGELPFQFGNCSISSPAGLRSGGEPERGWGETQVNLEPKMGLTG